MMTERRAVLALDIGGTKIAAGLISETGEILAHRKVATVQSSLDESMNQLAGLIEEMSVGEAAIAGVGIAVPGWCNRRAGTVWAPNIAGWDHIPLERHLSERVPFPVCVDSDRNAYVLGESWMGCAKESDDVVFLAVGTGIGAGIISGGHLITGHDDLSGCVGWYALQPEYQELYAAMGCFEAEASGKSIGRKAEERGLFSSTPAVVEAAEHGHPEARELLDEAARYLGMGVANLIDTLNPEMVVLGGGLFQQGEYLLSAVTREFPRWSQPIAAERTRLVRSQLLEDAGLFGAARIAWDRI